MNINFKDLNLISAGAGSGKTYTVQKTLSNWLKDHPSDIKPERILAVTFTKMAASEMQSRIRAILLKNGNMEAAMKVSLAQISTIHSFGQNIIQTFAYESGISPKFRQLSEAEETILLQLSLSSHDQIFSILQKLESLGYKGGYKGTEYTSAIEQLQARVLDIISSLRTIGATKEKTQHYIDLLSEDIKVLYGYLDKATTLNHSLHSKVNALLKQFPQNMKSEYGGNDTADKEFTKNFKALKNALDIKNIETDWELWKALQSLRIIRVDDDYEALATEVMEAAKSLSSHPGPLGEAIFHIEILLKISIDTLQTYDEEKKKNALIDYTDMVHQANSLMNDNEWLDEMALTYDCLVIDEFQDTNPIQFALLWKFRQKGLPTLIVGDLKQSIMGFQGADSSLFKSLLDKERAVKNELKNNWRSTPALMEWINAMGEGIYKENYTKLAPKSEYGSSLTPLEIIDFDDKHWSANGTKTGKASFTQKKYKVISNHIEKLIDSKSTVYDRHTKTERKIEASDIAILAPTHSMLAMAAEALRENAIEAQINQDGWFKSRIIQIAFYALSYLANPLDRHAALYLLVTELGGLSLQEALDMHLKENKFSHPILENIDNLREEIQTYTLSRQLTSIIESLKLWEHLLKIDDSAQQRVNLLKLVALCSEFESLQYESLNASGISGRNINSFLCWISLNESDNQPTPKSMNTEAVQLLTWYSSKGLEWPVVIVMGLDENKEPRLPDVSLAYTDDSRINPLDNSYVQFFTKFQDDKTNISFTDKLSSQAHETVNNLLYVTMTRAREQLVLLWPSFKKSVGEFSFMNKLKNKCNMMVNEDDISMDNLSRENGFCESVSLASIPEDIEKTPIISPISFGRVAVETLEKTVQVPSQISPSNTEDKTVSLDDKKLLLSSYDFEIDLSEINMSAPNLGTLIHHCYHVFLVNPSISDRLHILLADKLSEMMINQIEEQVKKFQKYCESELMAMNFQCEVPILNKTVQGSIISGSIDLLIETDQGYWIIDHKTDLVDDFLEQFKHHYPQLEAYANSIKLDKPIMGVGLNWIRYGKISFISVA